jgi:uncharacterized protein (TIGR02996 family)
MISPRDAFTVGLVVIALCGAGCEQKNDSVTPNKAKREVDLQDKSQSPQQPAKTETPKEVSSAPIVPKEDPPKKSSELEKPMKGETAVVPPVPNPAKEQTAAGYDQIVNAIRQKPWDASTVLALADWLEKDDKPRAKLVRLQL